MSDYDLIIKGGTVVNAADMVKADVGIRDGRVVAIAESLSNGGRVIDASGRYVMPGGVDSHCHIEQPSSTGGKNAETFERHPLGGLRRDHDDHLLLPPGEGQHHHADAAGLS